MRLLRHLTANDERLEPFPFKRELSMESYLIEHQGVLALDNSNFAEVQIIQEELTLKQGRKSKDTDGRIDILITYEPEYIGIVELKLGEINQLHLTQLEDYLHKKEQILKEFPDIISQDVADSPKWIGLLVGDSIESSLATKLENGYMTDEGVLIAGLTVRRFRGKSGGVFIATDTYFKDTSTNSRDTTKYVFNGNEYNKGRLVLAVMQEYVSQHAEITYSELQNKFPIGLQGSSYGVFSSTEKANEIIERSPTGRARHFVKPDELIELSGITIAVCSQWGVGNIGKFIKHSLELGFQIRKVGD